MLQVLEPPRLEYHSNVMRETHDDISGAIQDIDRPLFRMPVSKNAAFWILNVGGWATLALANTYIMRWIKLSDYKSCIFVVALYGAAALLSGCCRYLYRRLGYLNRPVSSMILYVLGICVAAAFIMYLFEVLVISSVWSESETAEYMASALTPAKIVLKTFSNLWPFMMWSILYFVINVWLEWRRERRRAVEATLLAQRAQLQMLRYQLNPHFLFNALNSVRALIDENTEGARDMITELADFLRYSLIHRDYANVPLSSEMEALGHYLSIQKRRYEENLNVDLTVSGAAGGFQVPCFLIHPLVENAIKYGMQTSPMPLKIAIAAEGDQESLVLTVTNTGKWVGPLMPGEEREVPAGTGTGLDNVRQRLAAAFPGRHRHTVSVDGGKVTVRLEIQGAARA
jgi:two-component system LytT family sensor kinase